MAQERAKRQAAHVGDIVIANNQRFDPDNEGKPAFSIEGVRRLQNEVYAAPFGENKIIIVPNTDLMGIPAQNAMLKILEEPPENCVFFLVVENPKKLLPTILSRAELVRTPAPSELEFINQTKAKNPELYKNISNLAVRAFSGKSADKYRAITFLNECKEDKRDVLNILKCIFSLHSEDTSDIITKAVIQERLASAEQRLAGNCNWNTVVWGIFTERKR